MVAAPSAPDCAGESLHERVYSTTEIQRDFYIYCKSPRVQPPLSSKFAVKEFHTDPLSRIADLSVLSFDRSYRKLRHGSYLVKSGNSSTLFD